MAKRIVAIFLLLVGLGVIALVPPSLFTPVGVWILAIFLLLVGLGVIALVPLSLFTPVGAWIQGWIGPPPPTPKPALTVRGTPLALASPVAYLMDADTGNVLVSIRGQERHPMASTTKIMTALIAIEKGKLDQIVTIKQEAVDEVNKYNSSSAQLVAGDQIRLKDLLYALMLPSGNDAAITVAETVGGSVSNFVNMMNDYARRLRLTQTHYINFDGLTYTTKDGKNDPNHYSSAADLASLARHALANPLFAQIVQLQRYVLPATTGHHAYVWETTNTLLSRYPGATGIKTGFTQDAGYCLVFSAISGDHRLIGVVLQGKDEGQRFTDARILLDWGFSLLVLPPPTATPG